MTLARPEAVHDLQKKQFYLEDGFVELNPQGRPQIKRKYRLAIPVCKALRAFVKGMPEGHLVTYFGKPVGDNKKRFESTLKRSGLNKHITPYCIRHTMATELRKRDVPQRQVSGFLGGIPVLG